MVLRDAIDQPLNSEAVVDPAAGGVVEGRGNVDADPSVRRAGVEIEGWMLLAPLATAVRLAAGTVLEHERAADERLVGQDLDGAGAGLASSGERCERGVMGPPEVAGEELYVSTDRRSQGPWRMRICSAPDRAR